MPSQAKEVLLSFIFGALLDVLKSTEEVSMQ
jgi:hypothetical protein